jgi:D-alanyl-D-alanine carboxypeptidase (penicillin-binding protein 5/6)
MRGNFRLATAVAVLGAAFIAATSQGAPPTASAPAKAPPPAKAKSAAPQGAAASTETGAPRIDAGAWILIDARDGDVLAAKAPDRPLPIASATKLMTAYVTLENTKPNQTVAAVPYRPVASAEILLGLRPGEQMKVRDLLYGLLLPSANDAAHTLAVGVGGSEPAFVSQMNQAAQQLGLASTSYANPIGLDAPDNYSSARDLVILAGDLLQNPLFARIVDTSTAVLRSGDRPRRVTSRNTLLGRAPWIDGVKTGHTIKAGYVLVGSGTQDSTTLISAVLGAPSEAMRDADTLRLLDYGFSLYSASQPVDRGEQLADPKLDYRDEHLPLVAKRGIRVSTREGEGIETRVDAPDEISGAVEEGETLGRVTVSVDGRAAASSPLVAAESVGAATLVDKLRNTVQNPIVLVPAGAFVILVGLLFAVRGRRPNRDGDPAPVRSRRREKLEQNPRERTPEERRRMHQERMRRRRQRPEGEGGTK